MILFVTNRAIRIAYGLVCFEFEAVVTRRVLDPPNGWCRIDKKPRIQCSRALTNCQGMGTDHKKHNRGHNSWA